MCSACSRASIYLINDIRDREADRLHPRKSRRPIASGALSVGTATVAAGVMAIAALTAAFWIGTSFGVVAITYLVALGAYSTRSSTSSSWTC